MDPTFPLVPIANLAACLLVLLSMSKNMFQFWNIGACSFAIWIAVESFTTSINSILWYNSVENIAPVWCDISECQTARPFVTPNCVSVKRHILILGLS